MSSWLDSIIRGPQLQGPIYPTITILVGCTGLKCELCDKKAEYTILGTGLGWCCAEHEQIAIDARIVKAMLAKRTERWGTISAGTMVSLNKDGKVVPAAALLPSDENSTILGYVAHVEEDGTVAVRIGPGSGPSPQSIAKFEVGDLW